MPLPNYVRFDVPLHLHPASALKLRRFFGGRVPTLSEVAKFASALLERELELVPRTVTEGCWCSSWCATARSMGDCSCGCHRAAEVVA